VVARPIGEAEYRAIAQGETEVLWLKFLFGELGYSCVHTPIVWSDNQAAKNIAENPIFHARAKHIEIDIHFIHEVEKNEVEIKYVPTTHQIADVFIKGLLRSRIKFLVDMLHMQQSPMVVDSRGFTAR